MSRVRVRSEAHKEQQRVYHRELRRKRREAAGSKTREQYVQFVREQAEKTKAAREAQALVIQPSIAKRQTMQAANKPGETVEQFKARGGVVQIEPPFQFKPHAAGLPMRASIAGNRAL